MFRLSQILRPGKYSGQPVSLIQDKLNGLRLTVFKYHDSVKVVTRTGKTDFWPEIYKLEHLKHQILRLPRLTVIDCECHIPGLPATEVKTALAEGNVNLQLDAFAVPWVAGADARHWEWSKAHEYLAQYSWSVVNTHQQPLAPIKDVSNLAQGALNFGLEGYVVKRAHYEGWWKIKPRLTVDCVVMGYTVSKSDTHYGGLKALQVGLVDAEGTWKEVASVGSGFTSEYRQACAPTTLVGRVCEVAYDNIAGQGKLNFPRFIRWRDDEKRPEECTTDQLG